MPKLPPKATETIIEAGIATQNHGGVGSDNHRTPSARSTKTPTSATFQGPTPCRLPIKTPPTMKRNARNAASGILLLHQYGCSATRPGVNQRALLSGVAEPSSRRTRHASSDLIHRTRPRRERALAVELPCRRSPNSGHIAAATQEARGACWRATESAPTMDGPVHQCPARLWAAVITRYPLSDEARIRWALQGSPPDGRGSVASGPSRELMVRRSGFAATH